MPFLVCYQLLGRFSKFFATFLISFPPSSPAVSQTRNWPRWLSLTSHSLCICLPAPSLTPWPWPGPPQCSVQPSGWLSQSALHVDPPLLSAHSLPMTSVALLSFLVFFFPPCLLCLSPDSRVALSPLGNTCAPQAGPWPSSLTPSALAGGVPLPWLCYQPGLQPKPPLWFLTVHLLSSEQPPRRLPGTSTSACPLPILSPPLFSSPVNRSSALAVVQTRKGGFVFDSSLSISLSV